MTESANLYLGVIAAATLLIAIVQIGVLVAAGVLARRIARVTSDVEQQIKPIFAHLDAIGRDAARAASIASTQVERADRLFADVAGRMEHGLESVQHAFYGPVRESAAILSALKAAFGAVKNPTAHRRGRTRGEDEDALFI